ncbi:hypothetical protein FA048_17515 [Pedobacter polaris]|uniref:Uncharacterized protein n=1 Tax=Pedobacter polaris TaxID=2571273 RepID=A0A4U1CKH6_9SPHI|nr:hypothetical protein [Pedobacter polaris]TKC05524.1 hypothetical protein FA048_17515 [Pedobacter polaris]
MKNYFFPIIIAALSFTACQSESTEQEDKVAVDTNIVKVGETYCYTYIKNKDTAKLTFMSTNGITTGELSYNLFEKDKNKGIIEGEMRGDTLLAEYTFNSEGKESVRQVAFLKKGNQLLEGFGDVEDKSGKMMFKNPTKLTFGQSIVFEKADCQ